MEKHSPIDKLKILNLLRNDEYLDQEQIDTLFFCTKCEACQEHCIQEIPLIELYDWGRSHVFSNYGPRNKKQAYLIKNILKVGNPFDNKRSRLEGVPKNLLKGKIETTSNTSKTLLHLGCMLGYRLHSMRDDVIKIMNYLDIDYRLLSNENCCGYFIFNTGDHKSATKIIKKNTAQFEEYDIIICACAGCYIFFKEHYPHPEKFHHAIEIIDEKVSEFKHKRKHKRKIKVQELSPSEKSVSFHDSCHLTRPFGITEAPRRLLKNIGFKIKEFNYSEKDGLCCGADGGMRIVNPDIALKIGRERVEEAKKMRTKKLFTLCPFCIFNFREVNKGLDNFLIDSVYRVIRLFLEQNL
jgi:fumarate reductase (CoM/CoB) subunit B